MIYSSRFTPRRKAVRPIIQNNADARSYIHTSEPIYIARTETELHDRLSRHNSRNFHRLISRAHNANDR